MKWSMPSLLLVAFACVATVSDATEGVPAAPPAAGIIKTGIIKTLTSGIPHAAFFGVAFDGGKGVAVGAGGAIAESSDSGQTWKPVDHGLSDLALLAVDKRGPYTIAVGQAGLIMTEDTSGKWAKIDIGSTSRMFSVGVNTTGFAVAVGEFGTVIKSPDGGRTWAPTGPDWASFADPDSPGTGEPNLYSVHVSESGEITLAGEFGVILRSSDAGASWKTLRPVAPKEPTIFAMYIPADGVGNSYAVGQTGELLISTNGGLAWGWCETSTKSNFLGVAAAPDGQVVITGMRVMLRSRNAGVTFDAVEEGDTTTDWYQAVRTEPASGKIVAVGHAGRIIQVGG